MNLRYVASALLALCAAPQLAMAATQDFTLTNKTGYEISDVYVSPSKTADWEEDVMGRDVLPNGEHVDITFSRDTDSCFWDMKVIYTDKTEAEWDNFNLCEVSKIKIFYNNKTDTTSATYE